MNLLRKTKAFLLGKNEVDIITGQLYNYIVRKKLVYTPELNSFFKGLPDFEKSRILEELKKREDILFEEDMIQYKENDAIGTFTQQQMLSALIKPEFIDTKPQSIQVGTKFYQGMTCVGLPETVAEDWLSGMTRDRSDVDYSIFIEPSSIQALQQYLTGELRKVRSDIYMYESRGETNPILEQKRDELTENLRNISKGSYKLYRTHLHLVSKGVTPESTIALSKRLQSSLKSFGIITKVTTNYQQQLLKSIIPTSINYVDDKGILVPDDALAASFPFSSPFYDVDEEQGILLGWGPNSLPIARNLWREPSFSGGFIGSTGTGKSVLAAEELLVKVKNDLTNNPKVSFIRIGNLVDNMISKNGVNFIDGSLEGIKNPDLEVYSMDPKTLKAEWSKVRVAARQPADPFYYRITTNTGREIEATGDHNFIISKNAELVNVRADELKEGNYVPLPGRLNMNSQENIVINLLELLKDENLYICDSNCIIKNNYNKILRMLPIDNRYDCYLNEYRKGRHTTISYFLKVIDKLGISLDNNLLDKVGITTTSSTCNIRPMFRIRHSIMRLLGYLISEGTLNKKFFFISITDKEVIKDIERCMRKLKHPYRRIEKGVVILSIIMYHIIKHLNIGHHSDSKKIPDIVFSLDDSLIAEMLKALYEGDGCFSKNTVIYCSKSKLLINQLAYILLRFEILSTIHKKWKRAANSNHKGDYYFELNITGENIFKFKEHIGFVTKRKNKLLNNFIRNHPKKFNTNLDIIPDGKLLIGQIDEIINKEPSTPQTYKAMWRKTGFSRQFIKNQISIIQSRIEKLKEVNQIIDRLEQIPLLEELLKKGQENITLMWKNYHSLWYSLKRHSVKCLLKTVLKISNALYKTDYSALQIVADLKKCYEILGVGITRIDRALNGSIYRGNAISYKKFMKNLDYLKSYYNQIDFNEAESILSKIEQFANSDLFWDKIAKIEKIECTDEYVYDLTVDNENFLCGFGGMFIHNSMTLKFFIDQENTIRGTRIIIIDPAATLGAEPEYKRMCEKKNGSYISFSKDSKNIPAIMGLFTGDFLEDVFAIEHILSVMLGGEQGITKPQEPWLEKAILMAFEMVGITADNPSTWKQEPPRLDKLKIALTKLFRDAKSENARMSIEALISRLSRFTGDGMYSFIDQSGTELAIDNSFTVFEFKNTPTQIKETLTAIVMNYVKAKAMGNREKTLIVLEEAPLWLKNEVLADFLSTMIVLVRKSNTGMLLVLQDLGQLNNCRQGESLLGNLMFIYLMGCKKNLLKKTAMTFDLNEKEQEILLRSSTGEGILVWNKERFQVKIKIDPETYKLITTNPNDIQMYENEEEKLREESLKELFKEDLGQETLVKEAIPMLAKNILNKKLGKTIISKYPKDLQKKIRDSICEEQNKLKEFRKIDFNADKLLEFWILRGKKNIMPKDGSILVNENIRIRAEKDYDIIKKAESYYRNHPCNTKPFHLTKREEELYERVGKKMRDYLKEKVEKAKTKKEVAREISKQRTQKESIEKVKELSSQMLHLKKDLSDEDIYILKSLGYKESENDVFNFYGKLITVFGKIQGRESLQHLTYKHLYLQSFSKAQAEFQDEETQMETDVMIPLANGKRIFIEIQCGNRGKHEMSSKISKLEEAADYWIIACKKNDLKYYENIRSEKGFVCGFSQSLAIIHKLIKHSQNKQS